jgi:hypothetical protein
MYLFSRQHRKTILCYIISLRMEAADSSVTLVHLPDYTAHTENLSNTMTTMLALFRAVIVL